MMCRALVLVVLSACGQRIQLIPAPAPAVGQAQAEVNQVKLWANTALFTTAPIDLDTYVTALGVDIDNDGDQPVVLRFEDIRLIDNLNRRTAPFFMPEQQQLCMNTVNSSGSIRAGGAGRFNVKPATSCQYPPVDMALLREKMRANPPDASDLENVSDGKPTSVFIRGKRRGGLIGANAWHNQEGQPMPPPSDWREEVRFLGAPKALASHSLSERTIGPHTRVTGFLFFPPIRDGASRLILAWKPQASKELLVQFALVAQ